VNTTPPSIPFLAASSAVAGRVPRFTSMRACTIQHQVSACVSACVRAWGLYSFVAQGEERVTSNACLDGLIKGTVNLCNYIHDVVHHHI